MAPFVGPTRIELIEQLWKWRPRLPITIGRHRPQAIVDRRAGRWLLVPLEIDRERAVRAGEEALASGGMWVPEMEWRFLTEGLPLVDEADKASFLERIRTIEYPYE
jgi:hypothetical protein